MASHVAMATDDDIVIDLHTAHVEKSISQNSLMINQVIISIFAITDNSSVGYGLFPVVTSWCFLYHENKDFRCKSSYIQLLFSALCALFTGSSANICNSPGQPGFS